MCRLPIIILSEIIDVSSTLETRQIRDHRLFDRVAPTTCIIIFNCLKSGTTYYHCCTRLENLYRSLDPAITPSFITLLLIIVNTNDGCREKKNVKKEKKKSIIDR